MRNTKRISIVVMALLLVCSLSVAVYAYSSNATASVSPNGSGIYFHGNNNSDASPANIKLINHYAEYAWMGSILATSNYGDDQYRYNSLNSYYNYSNASTGTYTSYVQGITEYMPPITYRDTPSDSASYYKASRSMTAASDNLVNVKGFLDGLDQTISKAFDIDLSNYRKIDILDEGNKAEHDNLKLVDLRRQIPLKYGDTVPSIYIDKSNMQGIAFTQDLKGVYTLYSFEANKETSGKLSWNITGTKTAQGKYSAVNASVKEYFEKNPNPPTYKYETNGSELTIVIGNNN